MSTTTATVEVRRATYTTREAAARLGVGETNVRERIRRREHPFDGTVRVIRMGRRILVNRADLDAILAPQPHR